MSYRYLLAPALSLKETCLLAVARFVISNFLLDFVGIEPSGT